MLNERERNLPVRPGISTPARRSNDLISRTLPVGPQGIAVIGVAREDPCGDGHAWRHPANTAVAEPDHHDAAMPSLAHIPVALLRRWPSLKTKCTGKTRRADITCPWRVRVLGPVGIHLPNAVV